jgi:hypothetical protein
MNCLRILSFIAGVLIVSSCDSDDDTANPIQIGINAKINVKAKVGDILYEDIDATVVVEGFAANDELKWTEEFEYTGVDGENVLTIQSGYQYYVITARTWGAEDSQTISGQQLYEERADGPTPATYVFAPEVVSPKLKSVTKSMETDVEGEVVLVPYAREEFIWTDNVLGEIRDAEYDNGTQSFVPARRYFLEYENGRVVSISGYQVSTDQHFIETTYEYFPNGNVQRIVEENWGSGVNTEANFTYDYASQHVTVNYTHSNGQSLSYRIGLDLKNITWDQTKKGSTVCSEGSYTFDKGINPFRHLGYVDILLGNFSINNKIDEDVEYISCAFPDLTVLSYQYTYGDNGLPESKSTLYSNNRKALEVYTY